MAKVTEENMVMEEVVETTEAEKTTAIAGVEKATFGSKVKTFVQDNGKKILIGLGGAALFVLGVSAGKKSVCGGYDEEDIIVDTEETEPEESDEE